MVLIFIFRETYDSLSIIHELSTIDGNNNEKVVYKKGDPPIGSTSKRWLKWKNILMKFVLLLITQCQNFMEEVGKETKEWNRTTVPIQVCGVVRKGPTKDRKSSMKFFLLKLKFINQNSEKRSKYLYAKYILF